MSDDKMAAQRPESAVLVTETDPANQVRHHDEDSHTDSPSISDHLKEKDITDIIPVPSDSDEHDPEDLNDGIFHQVIVKEGREVLVTWTRAEESRVVRKVDFLFLPIFAVRMDPDRAPD